MKNTYKVSARNGQPAIFTDRGLICLMEAGNQSTREKDAAEMVAILNAAPELLAALKAMLNRYGDKTEHPFCDASISARAALAKAEGNV